MKEQHLVFQLGKKNNCVKYNRGIFRFYLAKKSKPIYLEDYEAKELCWILLDAYEVRNKIKKILKKNAVFRQLPYVNYKQYVLSKNPKNKTVLNICVCKNKIEISLRNSIRFKNVTKRSYVHPMDNVNVNKFAQFVTNCLKNK